MTDIRTAFARSLPERKEVKRCFNLEIEQSKTGSLWTSLRACEAIVRLRAVTKLYQAEIVVVAAPGKRAKDIGSGPDFEKCWPSLVAKQRLVSSTVRSENFSLRFRDFRIPECVREPAISPMLQWGGPLDWVSVIADRRQSPRRRIAPSSRDFKGRSPWLYLELV